MDKRSLLARIVKSYPAIQSLITGEQTRQDAASDRLLGKPGTAQGRIRRAGAQEDSGQLEGNRHRPQLRRPAARTTNTRPPRKCRRSSCAARPSSRAQLVRARGTDFANARTDVVEHRHGGPGDRSAMPARPRRSRILGAWDSDPEQGIISYLSPVAQALLGHKPGDEVEFELEGVVRRHRLERIQPHALRRRPFTDDLDGANRHRFARTYSGDFTRRRLPSANGVNGRVAPPL
ncbi:MAG: GreA/GreB family elongation factor [Candidatus Moduliflexus flocculans]|nr:GreA/GreB family elongation factor [Candidatus Moduliflexus flocculans]